MNDYPGPLKVALLIETSNAYARGVLGGVVRYIQEHEPWSLHLTEQSRGEDPPSWLSHWQGDGIIARIESRKIAKAIARCKLPTVDVSAARHIPTLPWVETDDRAIAKLAADHFLERGFRYFAYCGAGYNWSRSRGEHFVDLIQAAGYHCLTFAPPDLRSEKQVAALEEWLSGLPKPVGIFASYDIRGQQVLDACRNRGIAVPDEVAVLGVDNDELLCQLASPGLSSVILDTHRTGYEAAAMLARMMKGERLQTRELRIAPIGVQCRQSTDVLAIDDHQVVQAVRFIREHACDSIRVQDVLHAVPLSRRTLETHFRKLLNNSVYDEIVRVRIERVKQLLAETDMSVANIAARAGFEHAECMSVAFRRETGLTPERYRLDRANQLNASGMARRVNPASSIASDDAAR